MLGLYKLLWGFIYLWNKTPCRFSCSLATTYLSFPYHTLAHPTATHIPREDLQLAYRLSAKAFLSLGIILYSILQLPTLSYFPKYSFYPSIFYPNTLEDVKPLPRPFMTYLYQSFLHLYIYIFLLITIFLISVLFPQ